MTQVMLVEDDAAMAAAVRAILRGAGVEVDCYPSAELALTAASERPPRLVLLDVHLPGRTGIELLPDLLRLEPAPRVLVITAHPTAEIAMDAMARGASGLLPKPLEPERLREAVREALAASGAGTREAPEAPRLVGSSSAMLDLGQRVGALARSDVPVLIRGPSGTGKELVARAIHERSTRAARPLIAVSCAALPETLFEAELFGHERGAFTGAHQAQTGQVERAEGGTLFLDEIGELSAGAQAKLLRFLEDLSYARVGGGAARRADVRVLAATNAPLETWVEEGRFRADLYYRLDVTSVWVPSLAERLDDLPQLVDHFLARAGRPDVVVEPEALARMRARPWPGNLRELRNAVESALVSLGDGQALRAEHVPAPSVESPASAENDLGPLVRARLADHTEQEPGLWATLKAELERELIAAALEATDGNQVAAARLLDLNRATLRRKMDDYGMR